MKHWRKSYWKLTIDYDKGLRGTVIRLIYGPGAGYIGGFTGYIALDCKIPQRWNYPNSRRQLQIGLTQNANMVPLCEH